MSGGRPLKFQSVEELEEKIQEYFQKCADETRPVTVSGLAIHLDCDIDTIKNYEEREEFFGTIKKAKDFIQNYAEEQLFTNPRTAGIIFNLVNNWGWRNKTETDVNQKSEVTITGFNYIVPEGGVKNKTKQ